MMVDKVNNAGKQKNGSNEADKARASRHSESPATLRDAQDLITLAFKNNEIKIGSCKYELLLRMLIFSSPDRHLRNGSSLAC